MLIDKWRQWREAPTSVTLNGNCFINSAIIIKIEIEGGIGLAGSFKSCRREYRYNWCIWDHRIDNLWRDGIGCIASRIGKGRKNFLTITQRRLRRKGPISISVRFNNSIGDAVIAEEQAYCRIGFAYAF